MKEIDQVPFNRPFLTGGELDYVRDVFRRGHAAGNGYYSERCVGMLKDVLGVNYVALTTSCTDALEMAALLCELQPGDEVVVPSFTFVSTANAFARSVVHRNDNTGLVRDDMSQRFRVKIQCQWVNITKHWTRTRPSKSVCRGAKGE